MGRKKIKSDSLVVDGIKFRSKFETRVYKELKRQGIDFSYEPEKIVLQKSFKHVNPYYIDSVEYWDAVRRITYTPDFVAKIDNYKVYIEAKGWGTEKYVLKKKMFLDRIKDMKDVIFVEAHTIVGLRISLLKIKSLCLE